MELSSTDKVHFIGVGGISMSGLAHALAVQGFTVSGSDRSDSPRLDTLRAAGVTVFVGHEAGHVAGADVIIRTTAIREDNPEWVAAQASGARLHHRSEMLAWMLRGKQAIAVTGTHGKTTMTAMLGTILVEAGLDPTAYVGGDVCQWGTNYRLGRGPHVVLEADESDGSFKQYPGCSQIVSCIEADHLDQHGTVERIEEIFRDFLASADPAGFVVWGSDCPRVARLIDATPARPVSFGLGPGAEFSARDLVYEGTGSRFTVLHDGAPVAEARLQVPGEHNVRNALAALAAAVQCGVTAEVAAAALGLFASTGRRFERLGTTADLAVYDDYAHHPTEVAVTLAAARNLGYQRLIAVFQPHLYSRTRDLMAEFAAAFDQADVVVICGIYAAREDPIPGVSAEELAQRIAARSPGQTVRYCADKDDAREYVADLARPGDLIVVMGAGDIRVTGEELAARLCGGAG